MQIPIPGLSGVHDALMNSDYFRIDFREDGSKSFPTDCFYACNGVIISDDRVDVGGLGMRLQGMGLPSAARPGTRWVICVSTTNPPSSFGVTTRQTKRKKSSSNQRVA